MATQHSRTAARTMISPAVILLLGWMLIPLSMTIYFSFQFYNLLQPGQESFAGWMNYRFFLTDPSFFDAIRNTLVLVGGLVYTFGAALLMNDHRGRYLHAGWHLLVIIGSVCHFLAVYQYGMINA